MFQFNMKYKTGVKTAAAGLLEKLILTFNNNKAKCDFVFQRKTKQQQASI